MKLKKLLSVVALCFAMNSFAQNSVTEIHTIDGIHYITTSINYPITGTYLFKNAEPIVILNAGGTGVFQQHDLPKRTMVWGIECNQTGEPKFTKGFDNAEYYLYYKYSDAPGSELEGDWTKVEFSIHFNSMKMFINGERVKIFVPKEEK
jgi:hypothetical protein